MKNLTDMTLDDFDLNDLDGLDGRTLFLIGWNEWVSWGFVDADDEELPMALRRGYYAAAHENDSGASGARPRREDGPEFADDYGY